MFSFKLDRLNTDQEIEGGEFGKVFPYQSHPNDLKWVVKRIYAKDTDFLLKSLPEIIFGFSANHPAVLPVSGYHIQKGKFKDFEIYLKLPRMASSLKQTLQERKFSKVPFTKAEILTFFYTLSCGLEYLHNKKIAHGDIKPANILLSYEGKAKLGDIGLGKYIPDDEKSYINLEKDGTIQYLSPERFLRDHQAQRKDLYKADIWSLGLSTAELCLLETRLVTPNITSEKVKEKVEEILKRIKERYGEEFGEILRGLLEYNTKERVDIGTVRRRLEMEYKEILVRGIIYKEN